jgi:hypothetical protein
VLDYLEKRRPLQDKAKGALQDSTTMEQFEEEWDMKHKIINSVNIGIALIVVTLCFGGMILVLNRKINNLHMAAAGLEERVEKGLKTYEFIPEKSGQTEGFVTVESDGSLIVTGGGVAEYGDELYDFITEYGDSVDCWYLKGEGEKDTGAFEVCRKRGLDIRSVYSLNLKEYKGKEGNNSAGGAD